MNPKKYLSSLSLLDRKIERLKNELDDLKSVKYSIPAVNTEREAVQHSISGAASYTAIIERIDYIQQEILNCLDDYISLKHSIVTQINNLDNALYSELLYLRYVKELPLKDVAAQMNYAYEYIRSAHGRALVNFARTNKL